MNHENDSAAELPFHRAAERVTRRLLLCRWIAAAGRSAPWVSILAVAAFAAARLAELPWTNWGAALAVIGLWLVACGFWALSRKPGEFAALALWDEKAGRKEEFASAFFFEGKTRMVESEKLHWSESRDRLGDAMASLPKDVPLPGMGLRWILPLLLLGFAFSPLLQPVVEAGDMVLTEEMAQAAAEEAARIELKKDEFEKLGSLTEVEQKEIEKLRKEINAVADELKKSREKTAREVLRELEARARAAEQLAERMGSRGDEWASEEMLREMSQHADTADLAEALKDKETERSAKESEKIAENLKSPELTNEVRDRVDESLARVMKKATPEDHKRPVGLNVGAAAEDMKEKDPEKAAKDFESLADHFKRLAERERAQEKLRKLAEELRKSGGNIAGKNLQSMEKLAGNSSSSMKPQQGLSAPQNPNMVPMNQQNMPNMGQGKSLPMPGMKPGKAGQGKPMTFAPVPGGAKGTPVAIIPGQGNKPGGSMVAPIPGTSGGMSSMMPGAGGLQAGTGSAPMEQQETDAMKAERSGLVAAQVNDQGESAVRAVEGGERTELAERERQQQVVEFIKVEEDALDEQTLPLSRKEHVLRYFTALRDRFEEGK